MDGGREEACLLYVGWGRCAAAAAAPAADGDLHFPFLVCSLFFSATGCDDPCLPKKRHRPLYAHEPNKMQICPLHRRSQRDLLPLPFTLPLSNPNTSLDVPNYQMLVICETVTDVAGEIVEIGSAVQEFKVGDRVVSKLIFWKAGGLAEYVAASENISVAIPAGVSSADAAGLPVAGLTALQAVKAIGTMFDGTGVGSNILITAASGGIGSYAVQLAKLGNHNVTATCGARNLELVADIGADEALDYKTPEGAALTNSSGKKYDYIVNTTNGGKWSAFKPSLSSHGRVVDVAPNVGNFVASILTLFSRKKLSTIILSLGMEDLRFLLELVKERKLKTVVDSRHPFEKAADAWEKSLSGHATGKVIVEM